MSKWKTPKGTELELLDLRGKDYLAVAWRLVWFREEHADWSIKTELVESTATSAFFRATISRPDGSVLSTAHKFEDKAGFPDFREKAETGAIGRALALCGYGTQFCADELDEKDRLADSPVIAPKVAAAKWVHPADRGGDQPDSGVYRVPFGKFAKKSLDEIDLNELRSYVNYLEGKAEKEGKPITGVVKDFIERAVAHIVHIVALENQGQP